MSAEHPLDCTGRTFLVTGASSGLGRAVAVGLSRLGGRILAAGRDAERLAATLADCPGDGHEATPYDLGDLAGIAPWLDGLAKQHGPLYGVAHCAGIQITQPLRFLTDEQIDETLQVNVQTALSVARAFRRRGVAQRGAGLVFLSSVMGLVGQPGQVAYSASKGALIALTRSLALEYAREGLRVNCVAPGVVEAGMGERLKSTLGDEQWAAVEAMHPLGLGRPEDVAHAVAYLLADTGRWVTGTVLTVDGGYTAH